MLWTPRGNFCGGSEAELPPPCSSAIGLAPGETLSKSFYKINSGGWKERSRRGVSGLGRDGCGAGVPGWEGSGCCGSNVRKSLGWGPGEQGEGRAEFMGRLRGGRARGRRAKGKVQCGDGEGLVWGQRKILCGVRELSGESPVWGQEWVRCENGEESFVGMVKDPVRGQRMVQCGNGEGSGVEMQKGLVCKWGKVQCGDREWYSVGMVKDPVRGQRMVQ